MLDPNNTNDFRELLINNSNTISISSFIGNLLLTLLLTKILSIFFNRYGKSISNRRIFSNIFPIVGLTTMLIITIVKSSLALSLGLVGALSVIRFRTAIKEPEELSYLFLTIGIGLGFGANQTFITIVGYLFILFYLYISNIRKSKRIKTNYMNLLVSANESDNYDIDQMTKVIFDSVSKLELKRLSADSGDIELLFKIEINDFEKVNILKNNLKRDFKNININLISNNIDLND
mgnify:CR=1 FL=1